MRVDTRGELFNGSRKELALYPADSLHISKTLNPFDIPNTICLNCDNYQCTCLMERFYCQTINGLDKNRGMQKSWLENGQ
jgi:hypothetical protein